MVALTRSLGGAERVRVFATSIFAQNVYIGYWFSK